MSTCLFACLFFILSPSPVRSTPWKQARMQPAMFERGEVGWALEVGADQAGSLGRHASQPRLRHPRASSSADSQSPLQTPTEVLQTLASVTHIILTWRPTTFLISQAQSLPAILESPLASVSRGLGGGALFTQTRGSQDLCLELVSEEPAAISSLPPAG